ncbi:MAG: hypothetical protein ACR2L2_09955 [Acidobacteriota bacterium]
MTKCVLEGDKLTFEIEKDGGTMSADLKVEGDQITGQIKRSDDPSRVGKFSVKRTADK